MKASDLKIILSPQAALKLETWGAQTRGLEFSGYGFVEKHPDHLLVYDVVILDVGTSTYTEIKADQVGHIVAELMQRPDADRLKLWFHRHPIGSGIPGPSNWSGRDEQTCRREPFGLPAPEKGWTCSIVRTPHGWVGRIDTYGSQGQTLHLPVEGQAAEALEQLERIQAPALQLESEDLVQMELVGMSPVSQQLFLPRDEYNNDLDYLEDIADVNFCEVEDLEVDEAGDVWLNRTKVGSGVRSRRLRRPKLHFGRNHYAEWRAGLQKFGGGRK